MQVKWTEDDERLSRMINRRVLVWEGTGAYYVCLIPDQHGGYTAEYRRDGQDGYTHTGRTGVLANKYVTPWDLHWYDAVYMKNHAGDLVERSGAEARDRATSMYP